MGFPVTGIGTNPKEGGGSRVGVKGKHPLNDPKRFSRVNTETLLKNDILLRVTNITSLFSFSISYCGFNPPDFSFTLSLSVIHKIGD